LNTDKEVIKIIKKELNRFVNRNKITNLKYLNKNNVVIDILTNSKIIEGNS
jgi:hypothetical protein